jgi:hypothetical protein
LFCWIDQYIKCENRSNGSKVIQGGWPEDFLKFPDRSPKKGFAKILMALDRVSASWPESIGVLQVKIGWTYACEMLLNSVFGLKSTLGAFFPKKWPLDPNFCRSVENLVRLSPGCADWANLRENRIDGSKVINGFVYAGNPYSRSKIGGFGGKWTPWKFSEALGPQKALSRARPRLLTYRSSKSAEPFLLGAVTSNEQNKKKN